MRHNRPVAEGTDYKATIGELAELMQEYRLTEARLQSGDLTIAFRRRSTPRPRTSEEGEVFVEAYAFDAPIAVATAPAVPKGTPVTSPMTGIYYAGSSPGAPPFAKEGDSVSAGQVVGLIEAMKVFNEIPSPVSGTVLEVVAQSGQLVNPGDVLLYIG
jgi:acetyl-CoA carboxylase biotin carboxyl carrier protein